MNLRSLSSLGVALVILSGCAERPSQIVATWQSSLRFDGKNGTAQAKIYLTAEQQSARSGEVDRCMTSSRAQELEENYGSHIPEHAKSPPLMAIGDSLFQGLRSFHIDENKAKQSAPLQLARMLGFSGPGYEIPKGYPSFGADFEVETRMGRANLITLTNDEFFKTIAAENFKALQISRNVAFTDWWPNNLAIGGTEVRDIWILTAALARRNLGERRLMVRRNPQEGTLPGEFGNLSESAEAFAAPTFDAIRAAAIEFARDKISKVDPIEDLFTNPSRAKEASAYISDMLMYGSASIMLDPGRGPSWRSELRAIDYLALQKPKMVIVSTGHNNGFYSAMTSNFGSEWVGKTIGRIEAQYEQFRHKDYFEDKESEVEFTRRGRTETEIITLIDCLRRVPGLKHAFVNALPRPSAVANMKIAIETTKYMKGYHDGYEYGFGPKRSQRFTSLLPHYDEQVHLINETIRGYIEAINAKAGAGEPQFHFIDMYELVMRHDTKGFQRGGRCPTESPASDLAAQSAMMLVRATGQVVALDNFPATGAEVGARCQGGLFGFDNMHLSTMGYRLMAEHIAAHIVEFCGKELECGGPNRGASEAWLKTATPRTAIECRMATDCRDIWEDRNQHRIAAFENSEFFNKRNSEIEAIAPQWEAINKLINFGYGLALRENAPVQWRRCLLDDLDKTAECSISDIIRHTRPRSREIME